MVGASWAVLKQRPDAVLLAIAGIAASVATSGLTAWLLISQGVHPHGRLGMSMMFAVVVGVGTIPTSFTNFAVTWIADEQMRGYNPTVSDALAIATRKLPRLLGWTLVSLTIGTVIRVVLERLALGGVIATWLLGLAWGLATVFVVPILVIEDVSVRGSIRRSAATFKRQWGQTMAAQVGVGVLALVVLIPLLVVFMFLMPAAAAQADTTMTPFITLMALFGVVFVALMGVIGVLQSVVNVALYRFATQGLLPHEFTRNDLAGAFQPKKRWFGSE